MESFSVPSYRECSQTANVSLLQMLAWPHFSPSDPELILHFATLQPPDVQSRIAADALCTLQSLASRAVGCPPIWATCKPLMICALLALLRVATLLFWVMMGH